MATYLIPLSDILTDAGRPGDLTALPEEAAIAQIKQTYGYWGPLLDVRIEQGVAIIDLPDENAHKAGAALEKIAQAARAGRAGQYQQAQTLYQDALKLLPQHTEARRELAMVQMELGNTAAAKQNLIRVLQLAHPPRRRIQRPRTPLPRIRRPKTHAPGDRHHDPLRRPLAQSQGRL